MNKTVTRICLLVLISAHLVGLSERATAMGLRSFVALPVEKEGGVLRLSFEKNNSPEEERFIVSAAYGLSHQQALLFSLPYRFSSETVRSNAELSFLYRHTVWQEDRWSGTSRLSLLAGVVVPLEGVKDEALQSGFVFTYFKDRYELDIDALYQPGTGQRRDSGRFDLSWQYRLAPEQRPNWGLPTEIHLVLELNGRWRKGDSISQQITAGLQWITSQRVIEVGVAKDLSKGNDLLCILSTRLHF